VGNYLKEFGWKTIALSVEEMFYEEKPDPDFARTFSEDFEVIRVKAFHITRPRLIGDIGLRAFIQLYKGALKIIQSRHIDFIWIPIPSFYCALLGRFIHRKTNLPYGIDYIDPWVRDISSRRDWRHKLSNMVARALEPIAVKKAALITGVSFEYYKPVIDRNFKKAVVSTPLESSPSNQPASPAGGQINKSTNPRIIHSAFPYGFDPNDHKIKLHDIRFPWSGEKNVIPWIYAGAFLPNSRIFVKLLFQAIAELRLVGTWDEKIRIYFVGTGEYPGKTIYEYATAAGIDNIVSEERKRFPYLQVLNFLAAADTVMVIGSTEKHYTASKVYQALLSERPVWAIFHEESSAIQVMEECKADRFLVKYHDGMSEAEMLTDITSALQRRLSQFDWKPDLVALEKYSARESAKKLAEGMEAVLSMSPR
jgi:hypothetical protein